SETVADVNCNGQITPGDALCIFQRYLYASWQPDCECSRVGGALAQGGPAFEVSLGEVTVTARDRVKVPIMVANPQGLSAFGLDLLFPPELLQFVKVEKTPLTKKWIFLDGAQSRPGAITLGGFHTEGVEVSKLSAVAEVTFVVKGRLTGDGELSLTNLVDDFAGGVSPKLSLREELASVPATYALFQNYPNPFNPITTIHYAIPSKEQRAESREYALRATLKIYNILGQEVQTLVDEVKEAGYYTVIWDGRDSWGREVSSGILC
ncbi:MAG: FlgD immunoglobulin-like domain containing protein, partial [bacterium]